MIKTDIQKITPKFIIGLYHFCLAFFGAVVYGFPSQKIKVIGITGTNGKTTTANLAEMILERAGYKVAVASSIKFKIGKEGQENKLKMTMPGRGYLQKFLKKAVKEKCDYAIIEATSEGVLQHRHRFLNFQMMIFTNLSPEHIERHGSFEKYREAKEKFFQTVKGVHIINMDDENAEYFLRFKAKEKWLYKIQNPNIKYQVKSKIQISNQKSKVVEAKNIKEKDGKLFFDIDSMLFILPLLGRFNVYNALAAISIGLCQGVSLEICQKALAESGTVPGRMEEIVSQPFRVIVDYAFTPNALEQVYQTLRSKLEVKSSHKDILNLKPRTSNLICVLGACGGGRDKWKRPVLGGIAAEHCNEIIITNEDPYDENPSQILSEIKSGILKSKFLMPNLYEIIDRREAIHKALEIAKPGDTVVITGKGSEPWICIENGKKIPWDDRQVAREEFSEVANFTNLSSNSANNKYRK